MCGIIGIISGKAVANDMLEALKRLEYRGYDSAGLATLIDGQIHRRRAESKLVNLQQLITQQPLAGNVGIGHTRWATHGVPSEANAHPHATEKVAVVHNGIIENYQALKAELQAQGHTFTSDTDTEVVAHLLTSALAQGHSPYEAMQACMKRLHGAFALAVLFTGHEDILMGARRGSPLVVGHGQGAMYLGSDALALAPLTQHITYLEEDDWVVLTRESATIYRLDGSVINRPVHLSGLTGAMIGKGRYRHFMLKEIHEQPTVIGDTLNTLINPTTQQVDLPKLPLPLKKIEHISIVACGTSYHAGLTARVWLENLTGVKTTVDIASEYRYRPFVEPKGTLGIFISQSGETADTLAALRFMKQHGTPTLAIVNVPSSTMAREADAILATQAGPEIGVASTKAFTTQLTVLACFTLALASARGKLDDATQRHLLYHLMQVPEKMNDILRQESSFKDMATAMVDAIDVLYIGRGTHYAIALEGALKLKELSYIHAEGLAAGELKHGPIALIDETVPVVVLSPSDALFDKTASNVREIIARKGNVFFFSDADGCEALADTDALPFTMPKTDAFVAPLLYTIPVQFLAYHVAVLKGTDVDQPRNLAKSVTVE